jgi:hypothetical protein
MRTITTETELYSFEELSTEAQERAVAEYVETAEFDTESMTDGMQYELGEYGLSDMELNYSLSNCQGDGVAFYGDVDIEAVVRNNGLNEKYLQLVEHASVVIVSNSSATHYSHAGTMSIFTLLDWQALKTEKEESRFETLLQEFEEELDLLKNDISAKLETFGYAEIEYQQSFEVISEYFVTDEYEFHVNGSFYYQSA